MSISRRRLNRQNEGFTMVVIAALFIAFAVVASVAVERNTVVQSITRRDAAADQLTRLSNAIIEYSVFNSIGTTLLYPCPAPENVNTTVSTFGQATVNCWNNALDPVSGMTALNGGGVNAPVRGMVPVKELSAYGIGLNDAFDPWNNRIEYTVNRRLTLASATSSGAQTTNPTLADTITGTATVAPDFILVSYGRDGVGAIKRGNTTVSIACTNATTTMRFENCDIDAAFIMAPTNTASTTVTGTYYDDVVSYYRQ